MGIDFCMSLQLKLCSVQIYGTSVVFTHERHTIILNNLTFYHYSLN